MKFGKQPVRHDERTLKFSSYLTSDVPAPPSASDQIQRALNNVQPVTLDKLFPMDGNDQYGDCTIAAAAHAISLWEAIDSKIKIATEGSVVDHYLKLSGGQDTGLVELDVLNNWRKHALGGHTILAYVKLDPHNHDHVKQAISLFGGVYLGFQVQENCVSDFEAGRPWIPGKLLDEGHAVFAGAYDTSYVTVLTWGNKQRATWAWWDLCVDEAYAILPREAKLAQFAPGYNLAQLQTDLAEITG